MSYYNKNMETTRGRKEGWEKEAGRNKINHMQIFVLIHVRSALEQEARKVFLQAREAANSPAPQEL